MPNTHYTVSTIRDRGKELSTFKLYNGAITALSIAGFLSDYGQLKTAITNLTLGVLARDLWVGDSTNLSDLVPTDPFAQREIGLRFHYTGDTTNKPYFVTLPCPDLSLVTFLSGDEIDITVGAEVIAMVAAIEQIGRTPDDDAETITVQSAEVVGRNN